MRLMNGQGCGWVRGEYWLRVASVAIVVGIGLALVAWLVPALLPSRPVLVFGLVLVLVVCARTCRQFQLALLPSSLLFGGLIGQTIDHPDLFWAGVASTVLFLTHVVLYLAQDHRPPRFAVMRFANGVEEPLALMYRVCPRCQGRHWYAIAPTERIRVDNRPDWHLFVDGRRIEPVLLPLLVDNETGYEYCPSLPDLLELPSR